MHPEDLHVLTCECIGKTDSDTPHEESFLWYITNKSKQRQIVKPQQYHTSENQNATYTHATPTKSFPNVQEISIIKASSDLLTNADSTRGMTVTTKTKGRGREGTKKL